MATSTYPFASELRSQGREEGRAKGREEGRAEGRAEGVAEARAQDIERLLDKRGITMTPADRDRISSCRDAMTLDTWLDRVLTIADISELFAD
jgi:DNA invertase Pin-like site-specific DNA recombinase